MPFSDVGPEGDYLKAKQQVQLLKAERDTLSQDLRPKHPKIIKLNDEIAKQEKLIELFRSDAVEKLETRRKSIGKQMENLQVEHQGVGSEGARSQPAARAVQSHQRQSRSPENSLRSPNQQSEGSGRFAGGRHWRSDLDHGNGDTARFPSARD